ncbi:MAG: 3',5'-cyclic-nucleotide phosphodiesterase [Gammaproteobacteria bacterium]
MRKILILFLSLWFTVGYAKNFQLIALGVNGGITDGNLSAYLIAPLDDPHYISLDAGTLTQGLERAHAAHAFKYSIDTMLANHIPVYLISHAHLDHVIGFAIAQPILHNQQILMAREETLHALQTHLFNWSVWVNFGDAGEKPTLKWQHYQSLPLSHWQPVPKTNMRLEAFPLNHGKGYPSTAFLIESHNNYVLYFGDTGADQIEKDDKIEHIWRTITPLIQEQKLRAILLECSFANSQPDTQLFGHLKPSLYLNELRQLATRVDPKHPKTALKGLIVFVTHIKPTAESLPSHQTADLILAELQQGNDLGVVFVVPQQGKKYIL